MPRAVASSTEDLALRIPKTVAAEANVQDGDAVDVTVENGALVVRPARRQYTIEELVADITPAKRHSETSWGPPTGQESW